MNLIMNKAVSHVLKNKGNKHEKKQQQQMIIAALK